jgi:hypothetical protein
MRVCASGIVLARAPQGQRRVCKTQGFRTLTMMRELNGLVGAEVQKCRSAEFRRELPRGFLPRGFSDACLHAAPRACVWQASENP